MFNFDEIMLKITKRGESPSWINGGAVGYLTLMGSRAYGVGDEKSDHDYYGFVYPPMSVLFPGDIIGFDKGGVRFEQLEYQEAKAIDVTLYSVTKYFRLVADGNPNMVDSLFTDDEDVVHITESGKLVKDNSHIFLSQKMYHTFKGMLYSHLVRLESGHVKEGRRELEKMYGYDTKDAYHSLRMALEMNEVLFMGDLHLKRHADLLKSVRRGEFPLSIVVEKIEGILEHAEKNVALRSVVPYAVQEEKVRDLLVKVLEIEYGSLEKIGVRL